MPQNCFQYQRGTAAARKTGNRNRNHSLDLQQPQRAKNTEKCTEGEILKFCNAINLVQPVERRPAHLQRRKAIKTLLKRFVPKSHLGVGG